MTTKFTDPNLEPLYKLLTDAIDAGDDAAIARAWGYIDWYSVIHPKKRKGWWRRLWRG